MRGKNLLTCQYIGIVRITFIRLRWIIDAWYLVMVMMLFFFNLLKTSHLYCFIARLYFLDSERKLSSECTSTTRVKAPNDGKDINSIKLTKR